MPEHIGNACNRAKAWTERIMLPLAPQSERGNKLEKFIERRRILFNQRPSLDLSTHTEGLELLHHELNDIVHRIQPRQLYKNQPENRDSSSVPPIMEENHPDDGMILPAPAKNTSLDANVQRRELQVGDSIRPAVEDLKKIKPESSPRINVGKVADKVYRLMRNDLILERERAT